ncbi:MAG: Asp-tRNA(Asn)/Glu-tRNA(Gln) amidotransferase subunit GatC [Methanoculleaceae archaeon]
MIERKDVEDIAKLADVGISPEEVQEFTSQFTDILDYFRVLDGVEDLEREWSGEVNVFRDDIPTPSLPQSDVLGIASATENGFIKAPRVMK